MAILAFSTGERRCFTTAFNQSRRPALNAPPFNLTGQNTLRFRPVSPINDTQNTISFSSVVLWMQRDSAAQG